MKPTVGCIVHYVSHGSPVLPDGTQRYTSQCRAAIVTAAYESENEALSLAIFNPEGMFFSPICAHHEADPELADSNPAVNHPGGTWHWPERSEA